MALSNPGSDFMPTTSPWGSRPPGPSQVLGGDGAEVGRRGGAHLHADVAPVAVVGPGWAVEAAFWAPLQAEGSVVHPHHMHCSRALFVGAWGGWEGWAAAGDHSIPLLLWGEKEWEDSPTVPLGPRKSWVEGGWVTPSAHWTSRPSVEKLVKGEGGFPARGVL